MSWTSEFLRRWTQLSQKSQRSSKLRRAFQPSMENLETREVPALLNGVNFLQGVAFVDNNDNGIFDNGDAPKPGAVIRLTESHGTTRHTTTDAQGYYRFQDLTPGARYTLTELASSSFTARSVSAMTLLSQANVLSNNSIAVTLGLDNGSYRFTRTSYTGNDVAPSAYRLNGGVFNDFTSVADSFNARALKGVLSGTTATSVEFLTYCMDLFHANPEAYAVNPSNQPYTPPETGLPATTTENIGRIAYLYNTVGRQGFSGADAGLREAGLALAFYELIYDANPNLTSGNYVVLPSTPAAVVNFANQFLNLSAGQSQSAVFLNVIAPPDSVTPDFNLSFSQGVIGTEMVNFANRPTVPPVTAQLGDFVWNDLNRNGVQDVGEPGINGVTVMLYAGTSATGNPFAQTVTTFNPSNPSQAGWYQFTGLTPGQPYIVCFATPAGFVRTSQFSGSDPTRDSNMNPDDGCTPVVVLGPGESNQTIDAGFFQQPSVVSGRLTGSVFADCDNDGVFDSNEAGISNVLITLTSSDGVSRTTRTDARGNYFFTNLPEGIYTLTQSQPQGFAQGQNTAGRPVNGTINGDVISGIRITQNQTDLVDYNFGERVTADALDVTLVKSANKQTFLPGELVTYTYEVTNNSQVEVRGLRIVDDNGTPNALGDDFVVAENLTLAAGETRVFQVTRSIPINLVQVINGRAVDAGQVLVERLASGDVKVTFIQSDANGNDNRYGTGAVPAAGWNRSRAFSSLVGSDYAAFQFRDASGRVVLEFRVDYISQRTSLTTPSGTVQYPSGWGTSGVQANEGRMIIGSASNVLFTSTSLTENLRLYPNGYLVNSPRETTPGSGISADPNAPNWEYRNIYTVIVSQAAFGSSGFGGVSITDIHNSPGKNGIERGPGTPVQSVITNIATATAQLCGVVTTATDSETVVVQGTTPGGPTTPPSQGSQLRKGDTATIGFWHNKNGQALIRSLNGGAQATNLANWLATNFPNLFGRNAGANNLTGKTNADVASLFVSFFNQKGTKVDAQIMASALAVYVTNSNLAGNVASNFGFTVTTTGTGAKVYNVGKLGTKVGLQNNTNYTVLQLLQQANQLKGTSNFDGKAFNDIFDGINNLGKI